ncbi:hypothetical protein J6590_058297 [Homalodisca vitripennis]|nr:hypothetical protein J6590_058297 [Homalodisca vitripennis]
MRKDFGYYGNKDVASEVVHGDRTHPPKFREKANRYKPSIRSRGSSYTPTIPTGDFGLKMNSASLAVVAILISAVAGAEDRTISGLTQLVNPGSQGPYPPASPHYSSSAASASAASYQPVAESSYTWTAPEHQDLDNGFKVQSGYQSFIIPTGPAPEEPLFPLHKLGGAALGASILPHLLPFPFNKIAIFLGTKIGLWLLGFVLLLLVGGAATTAVCAFTPLCTISFLGLGFNKEATRSLLTQDHLNTATQFVYNAIDKYRRLQGREGKSEKKKVARKAEEDNVINVDDVLKEAREAKSLKKTEEVKENKTSSKKPVEPVKSTNTEVNPDH